MFSLKKKTNIIQIYEKLREMNVVLTTEVKLVELEVSMAEDLNPEGSDSIFVH